MPNGTPFFLRVNPPISTLPSVFPSPPPPSSFFLLFFFLHFVVVPVPLGLGSFLASVRAARGKKFDEAVTRTVGLNSCLLNIKLTSSGGWRIRVLLLPRRLKAASTSRVLTGQPTRDILWTSLFKVIGARIYNGKLYASGLLGRFSMRYLSRPPIVIQTLPRPIRREEWHFFGRTPCNHST